MSNRTPLIRMMLLVTFLFIVLIAFSTQLSRNAAININDPIFKKTTILKNKNKAFSVLLHSITVRKKVISAYSYTFDSIITFPFSKQDHEVLQNKLDKLPPNTQDCNSCHKYAGY
ncbi:MAG: hypothetical protein QF380_02010 [Candidatus Marinimicrobia bacterium]|nr:hypothetical protein [Candidatus Neomarinimicrobiota bacterium]